MNTCIKKILSILCLLSLILCVCSLGGCGEESTSSTISSTSSNAEKGEIPGGFLEVDGETINALMNSGEVYVYTCHATETDYAKTKLGGFDNYFSEVYGGNIVAKNIAWQNWERTYLVDYAGGDAPDVVKLYYRAWPKLGIRNMVYSLEDLKKIGVVGLNHPYVTNDADTLKGTYLYEDELYGLALDKKDTGAAFIAVNSDLFKTYNVKSPTEYYNEGRWDFDTLMKCASEISRTLSDGTQIYGYFGWDPTFVLTANDAYPVVWDSNGVLKSNLTDPKVINALTDYQSLYANAWATGVDKDWNQGRCGMYAGLDFNIHRNFGGGKVTFEYDVIPFPYGKDNTSGYVSGDLTAYAISNSTDNPQGSFNYIIARCAWLDYCLENGDDSENLGSFTEEQKEMIAEYNARIKDSLYYGVGNLDSAHWNFWANIKNGSKTVKEVLDTYEPMFKAQCEVEMEYAK